MLSPDIFLMATSLGRLTWKSGTCSVVQPAFRHVAHFKTVPDRVEVLASDRLIVLVNSISVMKMLGDPASQESVRRADLYLRINSVVLLGLLSPGRVPLLLDR